MSAENSDDLSEREPTYSTDGEVEQTFTIENNFGFKALKPAAQKMLKASWRNAMPPGTTRVLIIAAHNGTTAETATGFWFQFVYYKDDKMLKATELEYVLYGLTEEELREARGQ